MSFIFSFLFIFIFPAYFIQDDHQLYASETFAYDENTAVFSGRISKLNLAAGVIRVKTSFKNMKFLNVLDRIEFWNPTHHLHRCAGRIQARSNDYLLYKIDKINECMKGVYFTTGSYLLNYSPDLEKNLATALQLMEILQKKRLALEGKKKRTQNDLNAFMERIDLLNQRYEILRQKLNLEWQSELHLLEEDKSKKLVDFKRLEARLNELEHKMEVYRVYDQNLVEDRWSLDPNLYIKK